MKIEAGKRYVRRDGAISGMIREDCNDEDYPFWDDSDGSSYNEYGMWLTGTEHDEDLIREYVEPQPAETETLRDRFAMAALGGLIESSGVELFDGSFPRISYEYADAMLKARGNA